MDTKVDRFEIDCMKKYIKIKLNELSRKNMKNIKMESNESEMARKSIGTCCKSNECECTAIDNVLVECAKTLKHFDENNLENCLCTFIRGTNGTVYRGECKCSTIE